MSWGERSCGNKPCPIPAECSIGTCNVDCREYRWDGVTDPDSKANPHAELFLQRANDIAHQSRQDKRYDNKPMSPETRERAKARRKKANKHKKRSR